MKKADLFNGICPSRDILTLVGSKWSMLLLCVLRRGPIRTGALRREISGISQKMLTQTLRDLERNGIVERISYDEVPPRVEYKLTRLGISLGDLIQNIEAWIVRNYPRMTAVQQMFDAQEHA